MGLLDGLFGNNPDNMANDDDRTGNSRNTNSNNSNNSGSSNNHNSNDNKSDKGSSSNNNNRNNGNSNNNGNNNNNGSNSKKGPVSVVVVTAPKTFGGPAIYVTPNRHNTAPTIVQPPKQTPKTTQRNTPTPVPQPKPTPTQQKTSKPTTQHTTATPSRTSQKDRGSNTEFTLAPHGTVSHSLTRSLGGLGADASSSPSATPQSKAAESSGLSGGAKAGIGFGALAIFGLIFTLVLLAYRKKRRANEEHHRLDDEKGSYPMGGSSNGYHGSGSRISMAPRLSFGRVSQFLPLSAQRRSQGNALDMAGSSNGAAYGAAAGAPRGLRPAGASSNSSAWEKPGDHSSNPANPFGNHAEEVNRSVTPGSSAQNMSPPAELAAGAAGARSMSNNPNSIVPKPLSVKSARSVDQRPSSPAMLAAATNGVPDVLRPGSPASFTTASSAVGAAASGPPASPGPSPDNVHRVQMDFQPSMDDELGLKAGQLVRMLHEYDDGWALCVRMDRSAQGVVPRTCLSKHTVKPRPPPGAQGGPPRGGPGMRGPPGQQGRPMTPTGRNSPNPSARNMGPQPGPNSQGPQQHRPNMGAFPGPPIGGPGRQGPQNNRNNTGPPRSASPGPYGASGGPRAMAPEQRRRSNSMGTLMGGPSPNRAGPPGDSPLSQSQSRAQARKLVPGQAM